MFKIENIYEKYTYQYLLDSAMSEVPDSIDKRQGSIVFNAVSPVCYELSLAYNELFKYIQKLDVNNLNGDELALYINQRTGIVRKPAIASITTVTITGSIGASIPLGAKVGADGLLFEITEAGVIDGTGTVDLPAVCTIAGVIGNLPAASINYFSTAISGAQTVTNADPIDGGVDEETDAELLSRYYVRVQTPSTSGNAYQYLNWALEIAGVGGAKVFSLWDGANTVKIAIFNSAGEEASPELVAQVQEYIDPGVTGTGMGVAPIGAFATVVSAVALAINISATVVLTVGYVLADVVGQITENLTNYFKEIGMTGNSVVYSKIGATISGTEGVQDYSSLLVNLGTVNITPSTGEFPLLGTVSIVE